MKTFSHYYVKYIIKTPIVFYLFLSLGVGLFLYLTLSLKLDVIRTSEAYYENGIIKVEMTEPMETSKVFAYQDRNDLVLMINVNNTTYENNLASLHISESDVTTLKNFSEKFYIDYKMGTQTLLERIFVKVGKG